MGAQDIQFDPDKPSFEYIVSAEKAKEALEILSKEKRIAVDIESTGIDPYTSDLILLQLGKPDFAYIFDVRKFNIKDQPLFKEIMQDTGKIKILQNSKFDYGYLRIQTGVKIQNMYDTMLAEGVLTSGLSVPLRLDAISKRRIDLESELFDKKKEMQKSFISLSKSTRLSEDQLMYAALDVLSLFPIMEEQVKLLMKEDLLKIAKLEFAVAPVVSDMELNGVYINVKKWREILKDIRKRRDELANEFQEAVRPYYSTQQMGLFGGMADAINLNSSTQLMDLFNNKLGLDIPSTSNGVLARETHPIVRILQKYRGYEKLLSTYGETLLKKVNRVTNRIHPEFMQIRTATGRFACNNPNLQNIPRNSEEAPFRECINPEPGYKLVVSDYSSFEMRILAELSGDEKMIHALNEGLDIHSYTASLMFDKPYSEDFKKLYPDLRQMAKPIGFGLMYGMGPSGLVARVYAETGEDITIEQSEDLIKRFFASYPSVETFLENTAKNAVRRGWSITPAGRKRWFKLPDRDDPDFRRKLGAIQREAKNHPIQGTNADAIKYALVFVSRYIEENNIDAKIISTVHDEIVCEVAENIADEFAKILSDQMIRAGKLYLKRVKIESDPFVGDVWEH